MSMSLSSAHLSIRDRAPDAETAGRVLQARRGDQEAVLWLLARYRPPLVRLLAGILGDVADAEDAAQEALLRALRHLRH